MAITAYGTVINIVEKDVLDSFYSSWSKDSGRSAGPELNFYKSYAMDPVDTLAFWLWPRPVADANVIVTYAAIPPAVTDVGDDIALSDMYVPHLVDYLAYRALSKDSRAGAKVLADQFKTAFYSRFAAGRAILRSLGQNVERPPNAEA